MSSHPTEFRTRSIDEAARVCTCHIQRIDGTWRLAFPFRVELQGDEAWFVFYDPLNEAAVIVAGRPFQPKYRKSRKGNRERALRMLRQAEFEARQIPLFPEEPP